MLGPPPQFSVIAIAEGGRGRGFDLTDEVSGLTFSNVNPGGDEICSFALNRPWFGENPEIVKGNLLRVIYGIDVLWQGRVEEIDRSTGDSEALSVTCYGLGNRLADTTFREIYIDADLSKWGGPSTTRTIALLAIPWTLEPTPEATFQDAGSALPAITFAFARLTKGTTGNEAWYSGGGIDLGLLMFNFRGSGEDTAFVDAAFLLTDDTAASFDATADYNSVTESLNQTLTASVAGRKYAVFQTARTQGEAELDPYRGIHRWEVPKVAGRHGLTFKGTWPLIGLSADQIVAHILSKATGISVRALSTFGYVIPQFTVETPTTPRDAIPSVNEFADADYGTWGPNSPLDNSNNGYFDYTEKQPSVQHWFASKTDFEEDLNFHTETASLYDTVDVSWTDETGLAHVERLSINSPDLKEAGLSPRVFPLSVGTMTKAGALIMGEVFLSLLAGFAPARGSGTLSGPIRHYRRGMLPSCYLRADGANIRIPDILPAETTFSLDSTPDRRTTFPIKRVTVDCSGDVAKANVEFDQTNDSLAVLLAQEAAQAALVG